MGLFGKNEATFTGKEPPLVIEFDPDKQVGAIFHTSMGQIKVRLFAHECPRTVSNFVGLATGKITWTDPNTGEPTNRPLYNGTVLHRVIPEFMIQGGDPLGSGRGGPGYCFGDEIHPKLKHNKPGILSMANAGPGTNGSQFFLTEVAAPWLDGKHAVFGEVIEGADLVPVITRVDKGTDDRPLKDIVLQQVEIIDI